MKTYQITILLLILVVINGAAYSQKAERFSKAGDWNWGTTDITFDAAGNCIVSSWDLISTMGGDYEYNITKYDSSGHWIASFPGGRIITNYLWPCVPVKVKADLQNNVYVSIIDGGPFGSDAIPYLRKYLPNGTFVWEVQTSIVATDIAVDDSLNVYITSDKTHFVFHSVTCDILTPLATEKISPAGMVLWTDTLHHAGQIAMCNEKAILSWPTICLSPDDSVLWTSPLGGNLTTFHNKAYISQMPNIYCLNDSGVVQWSAPYQSYKRSLTNSEGYSACITGNSMTVIDSSGNTVYQATNLRNLNDVAIGKGNRAFVLGMNDKCSDWMLCPIYVPYYPIGGFWCGDPYLDYDYMAQFSYDPLNNNFISIYLYYDLMNADDFSQLPLPIYFCAGDNLMDKYYDCSGYFMIRYDYCGQFAPGNQFIQLMDDDSTFATPDTVYNSIIPLSTPPGINYYKVVSTNPVVESNVYPILIHANPAPVITTSGTFTCPGDTITLIANYTDPTCGYLHWYRNGIYYGGSMSTTVTQTGIYTAVFDEYEGSGCDIKPASQPVKIRAAASCFHQFNH